MQNLMNLLIRAGVMGGLLVISGGAFGAPSPPGTSPPGPSPGTPLTQPISVGLTMGSQCGSALSAKAHLTRALATANGFAGKIVFGPVGPQPVTVPFVLERAAIGTTTTVNVTHPQLLDCTASLSDQVIEIWQTGASAPFFKKQAAPRKFFGQKLTPTPATPGPYAAKVFIDGNCGGAASGSAHLERIGPGSGPATIAMIFAGTTKQQTSPVPSVPDPKVTAPGPIKCKASTGLPTFQWTVVDTSATGTFGPAGVHVMFD